MRFPCTQRKICFKSLVIGLLLLGAGAIGFVTRTNVLKGQNSTGSDDLTPENCSQRIQTLEKTAQDTCAAAANRSLDTAAAADRFGAENHQQPPIVSQYQRTLAGWRQCQSASQELVRTTNTCLTL